jgi:hypothetical protein
MVDNGVPRIYIPDSWPIWQHVAINVVDNGIGVERVRLTIHGGQYGERVYNWSSGPDDFKWDRHFGEIIAPIGGYPVEVEAWDRVGNKGSAWGEIVIPAPDEVEEEDPGVLSVEPSQEPSEPPVTSGGSELVSEPTNTPQPPSVISFGTESSTRETTGSEEIAPPSGSSNLLAGAAAVSAISAVTAYALRRRREREEEEERRAITAAAFNARQRALEKYRARKRAWMKAMQRLAELTAIGAAAFTGTFASKGLMSPAPMTDCQYFGGAYQTCVTSKQRCYTFVDGNQSCNEIPRTTPKQCYYVDGTRRMCYTILPPKPTPRSCVNMGGYVNCFSVLGIPPNRKPATWINEKLLTDVGLIIYHEYLIYYDSPGWWWREFGQDDAFSYYEFMAMWMIREAYGSDIPNASPKDIAEGLVRFSAWWNTGESVPYTERLINWFPNWSQSFRVSEDNNQLLQNGYEPLPLPGSLKHFPDTGDSIIPKLHAIAYYLENPETDWLEGKNWYRPFGFANAFAHREDFERALKAAYEKGKAAYRNGQKEYRQYAVPYYEWIRANKDNFYFVFPDGKDTFIIFNACSYDYYTTEQYWQDITQDCSPPEDVNSEIVE